MLTDFFNILMPDYGWDIEGTQASWFERVLPLPLPRFLWYGQPSM